MATQQREMTEEEKQALVNRIFEDRPKSRRQQYLERLDGELSAYEQTPLSPDDQFTP